MTGSDDEKPPKKIKSGIVLPVHADGSIEASKGSPTTLPSRAAGTVIPQPWHDMPITVLVVSFTCTLCVAITSGIALYKVLSGGDASYAAYTLAGTCVVICGIVLAAFFGKNSKAGSISTS